MMSYSSSIIQNSKKRLENYKNGNYIPEYIQIQKWIEELDIFKSKKELELEMTMLDIQIRYKFTVWEEVKFNY